MGSVLGTARWRTVSLTFHFSGRASPAAEFKRVRTSEERNVGGWFSAVPKSASLQARSKDPFASRNVVLLSCLGIGKVSGSVVRQAVFVVKPIVGARMRNKIQVWCLAEYGVVASNPAVERTCAKSRAGRSLLR